jgi:hypothetical protein
MGTAAVTAVAIVQPSLFAQLAGFLKRWLAPEPVAVKHYSTHGSFTFRHYNVRYAVRS